MHPHEGYATAKAGNRIRYTIRPGAVRPGSLLKLHNRLHIAIRQVFDSTRPVISVGVFGYIGPGVSSHAAASFRVRLSCLICFKLALKFGMRSTTLVV